MMEKEPRLLTPLQLVWPEKQHWQTKGGLGNALDVLSDEKPQKEKDVDPCTLTFYFYFTVKAIILAK